MPRSKNMAKNMQCDNFSASKVLSLHYPDCMLATLTFNELRE